MRKINHFAINHDYIRAFVITYVILSAIIALFLGLFYFLVWIMFHYVLEIYKRYHLFSKLRIDDFLVAIQHCRWDFVFFIVAMNVEIIYHHTIAFAPGVMGSLLRAESSATVLFKEFGIIEVIKTLPRAVGFAKTSKSVYEIAHEILRDRYKGEKKHFEWEKNDSIALGIILVSFVVGIGGSLILGISPEEILKSIIHTISP